MKILLFILLIFLIPQAQAFEDYLILSESPVSAITWSDDDVLAAAPIITLDNKKNSIIVKIKKQGNAVITIETDNGNKIVNVEALNDKTVLSEVDGLTYFALDKAEEKWTQ